MVDIDSYNQNKQINGGGSCCDTPPNSSKDPKVGPRTKTMKEEEN